jgi:hypothetical protein
MSTELAYNALHQVVICRRCQTCIGPAQASITQHLRAEPHRLRGLALKAQRAYTDSLALRTLAELQSQKPANQGLLLRDLRAYGGYYCLLCPLAAAFLTTYLPQMQRHMSSHKRKAKEHDALAPLWQACQLQTYFTAKGRISYFMVVEEAEASLGPAIATGAAAATTAATEQALFASLEHDASAVQQDLEEAAAIVQNINASRTERVPWLEKTGFPAYLAGLQDRQIKGSYQLPPEDPNSIVRR